MPATFLTNLDRSVWCTCKPRLVSESVSRGGTTCLRDLTQDSAGKDFEYGSHSATSFDPGFDRRLVDDGGGPGSKVLPRRPDSGDAGTLTRWKTGSTRDQ